MKESGTIEKRLETRNKYKCGKGSMCKERLMLNSEVKSEVKSQEQNREVRIIDKKELNEKMIYNIM